MHISDLAAGSTGKPGVATLLKRWQQRGQWLTRWHPEPAASAGTLCLGQQQ